MRKRGRPVMKLPSTLEGAPVTGAEPAPMPDEDDAAGAASADSFGQLAGDAWRLMRRMPREWWALFVVMGIFIVLPRVLGSVPCVGAAVSAVFLVVTTRIGWTTSKMLADELGERPDDWRAAWSWSGVVFFRSLGFMLKYGVLLVPFIVGWILLAMPKGGSMEWSSPAWTTITVPLVSFLFAWRFATAMDHYVLNGLGFRASLRRSYGDSGRHLRLFALIACLYSVTGLIAMGGPSQDDVRMAYGAGKLFVVQPWPVAAAVVEAVLGPYISALSLLLWLRYGEGASLAAFDRPLPEARRSGPARLP